MSAGRRAPDDGYDFGNKRQYRRRVWSGFRKFCRGHVADKHALLMPSSEGDEIDVALNNGFRQCNLHVVDRNAAIVARLKRRFPHIQTYGVDLVQACWRIAERGHRLSCANLDLTSCMSNGVLTAMLNLTGSGVLDQSALVSVTLLRGRERGEVNNALSEGRNRDRTRQALLLLGCQLTATKAWPIESYVYRSIAGNQTMLVSSFAVHALECLCRICVSREAEKPYDMDTLYLRRGAPGNRDIEKKSATAHLSFDDIRMLRHGATADAQAATRTRPA